MSACCVLDVGAPMNSTVTIDDSDDGEVIDLDSSCDNSKIICLDDNSIYESKKSVEGRLTSAEDADADNNDTTSVDAGGRDAPSVRCNDDAPVFKVMFRDGNVSRQYRQQIKEFLQTLLAKKSKAPCEEDVDASNLILEVWDNKDSFNDRESSINLETINVESKVVSDKKESNDIICNSLFTIDTKPELIDDLDVPTYGKKYEATSDSETSKDTAPRTKCFNCKGNHNLRDCQLPRNQSNINKNRKEFSARYNMKLGVRYHLNEEQKFSHMIPGQLSQNLRAALGLKDNELPKHVYRMRLLGYPPGWLEEARLQHSGLSLFNSDGVAEADPNDGTEKITTNVNRDQYDLKKIYDFPGFNVPLPPGITDEGHKFCAPKMLSIHSKEAMLSFLQDKEIDTGYRRKKMKLSTSINVPSEVITSEMDIEDVEEGAVENVPINGHFIPPLPKETLPPPPPPPPVLSTATAVTTGSNEIEDSDSQSQELPFSDSADDTATPSSRANSPSLSELENIKKQLLVELEETSSQSNPDSSLKNNPNTSVNLNTSITSDTPLSNCSPTSRSLNTSRGSIKSMDLGTPILQRISPYSKLPPSEKFSRNICDVLNFENLPDSTGKYEEMTGVLQKVRNTMAKLHQA